MNEVALTGIDGRHLWGFLTALGSLSLLDEHTRERNLAPPRLAFMDDGTALLAGPIAKDLLPSILLSELGRIRTYLGGSLASINRPADFTRSSFEATALTSSSPSLVDFLAGLACVIGEEVFESTLCAANGASHQNLIQSMRDVLDLVDGEQLRRSMFEPWTKSYQIPDGKRKQLNLGTRKPTLRLDPADERLYALRLSNPTTTDDYKTEMGAQALAIPAYGLLPVVPRHRAITIASKRSRQRVTFSWVLWRHFASIRAAKSMIWQGVDASKELRLRGAFAAFSVDRVSGSKGKLSFSPSQGVW